MQESILQIFSTTDTPQAILTVRLSQICLTIKRLHRSSFCPRQPPGHRLFFKFKIIFTNLKSYFGKVLSKAYVMIYFSIIKNFIKTESAICVWFIKTKGSLSFGGAIFFLFQGTVLSYLILILKILIFNMSRLGLKALCNGFTKIHFILF
jgi:hypothetical protein